MAKAEPTRIYADTSVYGGVHDAEFAEPSKKCFDEVRAGRFTLIVSPPVRDEIEDAPEMVRSFFDAISANAVSIEMSADAIDLRNAYLSHDVVGPASAVDATHVALATLAACELLVSWNFKHIVHRDKAPRYNAVNVLRGLPTIGIYSPAEVVRYEEGI